MKQKLVVNRMSLVLAALVAVQAIAGIALNIAFNYVDIIKVVIVTIELVIWAWLVCHGTTIWRYQPSVSAMISQRRVWACFGGLLFFKVLPLLVLLSAGITFESIKQLRISLYQSVDLQETLFTSKIAGFLYYGGVLDRLLLFVAIILISSRSGRFFGKGAALLIYAASDLFIGGRFSIGVAVLLMPILYERASLLRQKFAVGTFLIIAAVSVVWLFLVREGASFEKSVVGLFEYIGAPVLLMAHYIDDIGPRQPIMIGSYTLQAVLEPLAVVTSFDAYAKDVVRSAAEFVFVSPYTGIGFNAFVGPLYGAYHEVGLAAPLFSAAYVFLCASVIPPIFKALRYESVRFIQVNLAIALYMPVIYSFSFVVAVIIVMLSERLLLVKVPARNDAVSA